MPGIEDFKTRLQQIREVVADRLPAIAEILTITAKGLAERRMKEQGFGVLYSANQVPAWFFHGKELNQKGTKFLEQRGVTPAGQKGKPKKKRGTKEFHLTTTTWGEFRLAQGLQAAFVDLSYSNFMWSNMQPVTIEVDGNITRALLGGTNREAQNKMNWNFARYGDFIRKSLEPDDVAILTDVVNTELLLVLEQFKV